MDERRLSAGDGGLEGLRVLDFVIGPCEGTFDESESLLASEETDAAHPCEVCNCLHA